MVVFEVAMEDDVAGVDDMRPAAVKDDRFNFDRASVEDAFLLVSTVDLEKVVEDPPCEDSGLLKLGYQRIKKENEKKDFQEEKVYSVVVIDTVIAKEQAFELSPD